MDDILEISGKIAASLTAIMLTIFFGILALAAACRLIRPSDQEMQCISIVGAKWSGENCYKNGVRINFDAK